MTFYQDRRWRPVGLMIFSMNLVLKPCFLFKSQLQMRRVEEFEAWEACKRKHQGFIRTKTTARCEQFCGLKLFFCLIFSLKFREKIEFVSCFLYWTKNITQKFHAAEGLRFRKYFRFFWLLRSRKKTLASYSRHCFTLAQ